MGVTQPITIPGLDGHAKAIGYVCFNWAHLESVIDQMLFVAYSTNEDMGAFYFLQEIDLWEKVEILKKLGHARMRDEAWSKSLKGILNKVRTSGETRNRYMHDLWLTDRSGTAFRVERRKLQRPQSGKQLVLVGPSNIQVSEKEIWDLAIEMNRLAVELMDLHHQLHERMNSISKLLG